MRFFDRRRPIGVVDTRGPRIQGWAFDKSADEPVTVEFYVDGMKAGSTVADGYRADLTTESPDGRCAFDFTLPAQFLDGTVRAVEVRAEGTKRPLFNGRFTAHMLASDYFSGMARWILRSGAWAMAGTAANGVANISGWCIAPPGFDEGTITANGRAIDVSISDGSPEWKTPLPPGMAVRTFSGNVPLAGAGEDVHFAFGLKRPFRALQDLRYPLFEVAVPEPERMKRVAGHGVEFVFNLGGYSTATKLNVIAERFAGRPLAGLGPVLDWGCGCGRVGRFIARSGAELFGVDIDADNARWCSEHIRGHFAGISRDPPTPFEGNFFGAIYGVSVFTHLDRHYERAWLSELHRIAKPGALLILSVHGGLMAAYGGLLEHIASSEFADGFADIGRNSDIDAVTHGSAYYRNVFHQPGYITKVWGEYFEILSIEEGVIENLHDCVVMRKPAR